MQRLKLTIPNVCFGLMVLAGLLAFTIQNSGFCDTFPDGRYMCCSTNEEGEILDCVEVHLPEMPKGD